MELAELDKTGREDANTGSVAHGMLASRTLYSHQASGPLPPWGFQLKFESAQYVCLAAFLGWSVSWVGGSVRRVAQETCGWGFPKPQTKVSCVLLAGAP